MAAVLGSMDSHLFELRNFKANELLFRERHSSKMKPARGSSSPGRNMSPSPRRGASCESQVKSVRGSSPGRKSPGSSIVTTLESQVKPSSRGIVPVPTAPTPPRVEYRGTKAREAAVVPISSLDDEINNINQRTVTVVPSLDDATLQKLAKMVAQEIQSTKKVPVRLDDFTGEKSPYLAEDAMVWLKKLRLAAGQNEWDYGQALEVASIHLKGLAARWFASIESHLNQELHLDRDRWTYFQSQFEERFADFRSRLLQIEKIKETKLRHGEDIREYAEAIKSMNSRLEEPLDDEFLRWVFIQGLPPSELRDKLYRFEEQPNTMAGAVNYARRFQLSQSVFKLKDSSHSMASPLMPRSSPGSTPARSVRSN